MADRAGDLQRIGRFVASNDSTPNERWAANEPVRNDPRDDMIARLKAAILDIDAHATPLGEDADGFVTGGYTITTGCLHRALGVIGHTAPKARATVRYEVGDRCRFGTEGWPALRITTEVISEHETVGEAATVCADAQEEDPDV